MQRLIAIALAFYSFFLIATNLHRMPARIPTHFNLTGEADGWGSPDTLWVVLLIQVLICGLFLVVPLLAQRFPELVNVGSVKVSDLTPGQRERIMPLFTDMMGYMSILLGLLFSFLLRENIHAAFSSHPRAALWPLAVFIVGTVVTLAYYLHRIFGMANETGSQREKPML